jgi:hypothetical protein
MKVVLWSFFYIFFIGIVFCILFGQMVFMTVFRLGLSMCQNCISGLWILILSPFHRPLLSLTLVLICWLGGAQGWCCESYAEVCMRAFELPPGALYRRAYWREVGLCRLVCLGPVFQGFTFPLAMFLAGFLCDCVGWFVTAPGVLRVVSVGRWDAEGRSDPGIQGGRHGCQG